MRKSKIEFIEKNVGKLKDFSLDDLSKIIGGANFKCSAEATLTCTPFTGSCLLVKIDDDAYACAAGATLEKNK